MSDTILLSYLSCYGTFQQLTYNTIIIQIESVQVLLPRLGQLLHTSNIVSTQSNYFLMKMYLSKNVLKHSAGTIVMKCSVRYSRWE